VAEHDPDNSLFDPDYLDIHRPDDRTMIQVTWNEGRTLEKKHKAIADRLADALKLRREDVLINLGEVKRENWHFGVGEPTCATQP
jgi:phenylpyruvate tautomerase PptA (4-oxalocrotonate tautomerase family)